MQHLIDAARASIADQNWYSALTIALTLPDICGSLQHPAKGSSARYVEWFTKYMAPQYSFRMFGGQVEQFLSGEDCYALRCAFLHQGVMDISGQRIQDALDAFVIITPPRPGVMVHKNKIGKKLQLQVDCFVEEICKAVECWMRDVVSDPLITARLHTLGKIAEASKGVRV